MTSESATVEHLKLQLKKKYKKLISNYAALSGFGEDFIRFAYEARVDSINGNQSIFPYYYVLNRDFETAWILFSYINIEFLLQPEIFRYCHDFAKPELEGPVIWDMMPLGIEKDEDVKLLDKMGSTCFRLPEEHYDTSMLTNMEIDGGGIYDLSPEARYNTEDETKNYYLSHAGFHSTARMMEICFRREMIPETEECLFRLRHIASAGEAPKDLVEFPRQRHISAWVNTYDYWYQARRESDPERRIDLAWKAFCWFLELGLRMAGNNNIEHLVFFPVGCEIIGEFGLMGEHQDEFLRHLKRFTMQASISHCRRMMDNPIQIVPFSERGTPDYATTRQLMEAVMISRRKN